MTPEQREELKQAAQRLHDARNAPRHIFNARQDEYRDLAPSFAILSLIAQVEALEAKFVIGERPADEQEWAKVDPAIAFHLIDRHADNWSDAGDMMVAWADAREAAKVEALTVTQGWKLVPIEPTRNMCLAGAKHTTPVADDETNEREAYFIGLGRAACAYMEMIAAAPTIPAIPGTKEGA